MTIKNASVAKLVEPVCTARYDTCNADNARRKASRQDTERYGCGHDDLAAA